MGIVPNNQLIILDIHRRTNTRERSVDAVVIRDLVRPDEAPTLLVHGVEIAAPIREVDRVTNDGRSSRNIVSSCKHPFWAQILDVGRTDGVLCWLAPAVVEILTGG